MASMLISVESSELDITTLRQQFDRTPNRRMTLKRIIGFLKAAMGGFKPVYISTTLCSAHATGTVTCTQASAVDGTDTVTIAGTTLEVEATPADQDEFLKGASNSAFASNLALCINGHTTLQKIVRAKAASNVVTITSIVPGPIGNLITLAEAGNGMVISGAALANGAGDEMDTLQLGYDPTV